MASIQHFDCWSLGSSPGGTTSINYMQFKITPLNYGKHHNLYLNVKIGGSNKKPIIHLKLIVFFETCDAFIVNSNLHSDFKDLLNFVYLKDIIQNDLNKHDWKLNINSNEDFFVKNLDSEKLLKKLKDENKCLVSIA